MIGNYFVGGVGNLANENNPFSVKISKTAPKLQDKRENNPNSSWIASPNTSPRRSSKRIKISNKKMSSKGRKFSQILPQSSNFLQGQRETKAAAGRGLNLKGQQRSRACRE